MIGGVQASTTPEKYYRIPLGCACACFIFMLIRGSDRWRNLAQSKQKLPVAHALMWLKLSYVDLDVRGMWMKKKQKDMLCDFTSASLRCF
jgi:hypothetical protein